MILLAILFVPLGCIALAILLCDGRPVFFTQERVGRSGRPFRILKFRTMRVSNGKTTPLTSGDGDERITQTGRALRKRRVDEFPQLINVLLGQMSLVGPRPEVPLYVDPGDWRWQKVLSVRPGITGPDSLVFQNEGEQLEQAEDLDRHYRAVILPEKLRVQAEYADTRTFLGDLGLLFRTFGALVG